jgi:NDP-sugar pyrophosphorylase family protein
VKALVFAAGLGTRLRPLTDNLPKALVDVNGVPLLELVIRRLAAAGAAEFIVNTHHFHDKIADFLRSKGNFGFKIALSREEERPLETGGGLKLAAALLNDGRPFFAYNSDVYSEMDLAGLYAAHLASGALATLAVRACCSTET